MFDLSHGLLIRPPSYFTVIDSYNWQGLSLQSSLFIQHKTIWKPFNIHKKHTNKLSIDIKKKEEDNTTKLPLFITVNDSISTIIDKNETATTNIKYILCYKWLQG